jgi:hypothetical protein
MTPIERAARAMCAVSGRHGFPILNADPDFGDYPLTEEGTDDMNPFTESDVVALVRAVLEAIREPSAAMTAAGDDTQTDYEAGLTDLAAVKVWPAMIDAALAES